MIILPKHRKIVTHELSFFNEPFFQIAQFNLHYRFLDNSLSFISYDYRDIRCEDYYNNLVKNGFTFKQRELGYWDGTGILLKDRVFVDLADMFESGYVWCTYYYDVPKVIKYFKIKK
jgi:hypothetical protein